MSLNQDCTVVFNRGPFKYNVIKEGGGWGGQMMMFDDRTKPGGWGVAK